MARWKMGDWEMGNPASPMLRSPGAAAQRPYQIEYRSGAHGVTRPTFRVAR